MIDTHIHLYDPTRPQGVPWPAKTDTLLYKPTLPETFAAMVRPLGITGTVVVEASPWVEDNQWVLDLAKEHRVIVGLVGHLEAGGEGFAANLSRFAKNPLFRGIRLNGGAIGNGMARPGFVQDLERLADAGLMLDAIGKRVDDSGPDCADRQDSEVANRDRPYARRTCRLAEFAGRAVGSGEATASVL